MTRCVVALAALLACRASAPAGPSSPSARPKVVEPSLASRPLPEASHRILPGPKAQVIAELTAASELAGYSCSADAQGDPSCQSDNNAPRFLVWLGDRDGTPSINLLVAARLPPQTTCDDISMALADQRIIHDVLTRCEGGEIGMAAGFAFPADGVELRELQRYRRVLETLLLYGLARVTNQLD